MRIVSDCLLASLSGGGNLELAPQGFRGNSYLENEQPRKFIQLLKTKAGLLRQKSRNDRFGFTLAEVLITLGIIGVVAALTMPALIVNYQKKQTVAQLKKVYTVLYQAILLSETQNGSSEYWDNSLTAYGYFFKYIKPYVKGIQETNYDRNKMVSYKRPNGTIETAFTPFYQNAKIFVLNDGSILYLQNNNVSSYFGIVVDLNGFRGPNIIGRDVFMFSIPKDDTLHKLVPYGAFNTSDMPFGEWTRENTKKGSYACSREGRGQFCAALIMIDGWEIKDDYPW